MIINFKGETWDVYSDWNETTQNTSLWLKNVNKRGFYLPATINVAKSLGDPNLVAIKDYSESEGVYDALIQAGIIEYTGKSIPSGWVMAPICRILVDL